MQTVSYLFGPQKKLGHFFDLGPGRTKREEKTGTFFFLQRDIRFVFIQY